jgi:tetratricopeptide (TPR) repeat protein
MNIRHCDTLVMQGKYEDAILCLEPIYTANPQGPAYEKLLDAYLLSNDTVGALKVVRKQSKRFGDARPQYTVDYWVLSQKLGKRGPDWEDIELQIVKNPYSSRAVARVLERYGLLREAVSIYELAEQRQPKLNVSFERAQLYAQLGDIDEQYAAYLKAIDENRGYLNNIKLRITQNIGDDEASAHAEAAKAALISRIQSGGNVGVFENLLLFVFRELGEYDRAFRWLKAKAKSDDFRANEFMSIARDLREAENYALAAEVYDFMIYSRPRGMQGGWLNQALEEQLEILAGVDQAKAQALVSDFGSNECGDCFKWELAREEYNMHLRGIDSVSVEEYAKIMGELRLKYPRPLMEGLTYKSYAGVLQVLGNFDRALIEYARAETLLGDSKEGDQCRLARAMCAFYDGDIPWAKTQLEVLLKSTSKEIANDALENALLIAANSVEDTLYEGLQLLRVPMLYEIMGQQQKALDAYNKIENILLANEVYDDLLYKKGKLLLSMGYFQEAKQSFLVLQNAAGEGMWKEEGYFYFAKAAFELDPNSSKEALMEYLINYPNGFYTEQARRMYRTFAL